MQHPIRWRGETWAGVGGKSRGVPSPIIILCYHDIVSILFQFYKNPSQPHKSTHNVIMLQYMYTYTQRIRPSLNELLNLMTSCIPSRLLALTLAAGFHVSTASTMFVSGSRLQPTTSAENCKSAVNRVVKKYNYGNGRRLCR